MKQLFARLLTIISLFALLISSISSATANDETNKDSLGNVDVHDYYTVMPGDEAWSSYTYQEALKLVNPAPSLLKELPSETLLQLAISYPFLMDAMAFDNWDYGIEVVVQKSTVLKEFFSRSESKSLLINFFLNYSLKEESLSELENYQYYISVQLLLMHPQIHSSLSPEEASTLYAKSCADRDFVNVQTNVYSQAFLLSEETIASTSLLTTTTSGFTGNGTYLTRSGTTYQCGTYTKFGKTVSCLKFYSNDLTAAEKASLNTTFDAIHPTWTRSGTATRKYNCHAYAWLFDYQIWLDNPSQYANATSYFTNLGTDCAIPSSQIKITIYDSDGIAHSAISLSASSGYSKTSRMTTTNTISKLGTYALYEVSLNDLYTLYGGQYYHAYQAR